MASFILVTAPFPVFGMYQGCALHDRAIGRCRTARRRLTRKSEHAVTVHAPPPGPSPKQPGRPPSARLLLPSSSSGTMCRADFRRPGEHAAQARHPFSPRSTRIPPSAPPNQVRELQTLAPPTKTKEARVLAVILTRHMRCTVLAAGLVRSEELGGQLDGLSIPVVTQPIDNEQTLRSQPDGMAIASRTPSLRPSTPQSSPRGGRDVTTSRQTCHR